MTCRLHQSFLVSVVFDRVTPQMQAGKTPARDGFYLPPDVLFLTSGVKTTATALRSS